MVYPTLHQRPSIGEISYGPYIEPSPPPPSYFRNPFKKGNSTTNAIVDPWSERRQEQMIKHTESNEAKTVSYEKMRVTREAKEAEQWDAWKKEESAVNAYLRASPHLSPERVKTPTTKKKLPRMETMMSGNTIETTAPLWISKNASKNILQNGDELVERLIAVPEASTPRLRSPAELTESPSRDMRHMPLFKPIGTRSHAFPVASSGEYSDSKAKSLLGLDPQTQLPTRPASLASQVRDLWDSDDETDSPTASRSSPWMRVRNAVTDTGSHVGRPRTKSKLHIDTTASTPNVNKSLPAIPHTPRTPLFRSKSRRVKFRCRIASYSSIKNKRPLRNKRVSTAPVDVETLKAIAYNPHGPPIYTWERASPSADSDSDWEDHDSPVRESSTSSYIPHTLLPVAELPTPTPTPTSTPRPDYAAPYLTTRPKPEREPEPYRGSFTPQIHITSLDDPLEHYGLYNRCFPAPTSSTSLPTPRPHRPFSQLLIPHHLRGTEDRAKSSAIHQRTQTANLEKSEIIARHPHDAGYAIASIRRYNERADAEQNSYSNRLEFLRAEKRKLEATQNAQNDALRQAWKDANSPWYVKIASKRKTPVTMHDLGSVGPASCSTWSLDSQDKPGAGTKFSRALHRIHSPSPPTLSSNSSPKSDADVHDNRPPGKLRKFFSTESLVDEVEKLERFVMGRSEGREQAERNRERLKRNIKIVQGASEVQYSEMRLTDTMRQDLGVRDGRGPGRSVDYF